MPSASPERAREVRRAWRERNPEKVKRQIASWVANNPEKRREINRRRRARKLAVPHTPWTKLQLLELYGCFCWLCHKPLPALWHADHVIPISKGGWDVPTNLRPACPTCNQSKNDRLAGDPVATWWALFSMFIGMMDLVDPLKIAAMGHAAHRSVAHKEKNGNA